MDPITLKSRINSVPSKKDATEFTLQRNVRGGKGRESPRESEFYMHETDDNIHNCDNCEYPAVSLFYLCLSLHNPCKDRDADKDRGG